MIALYPMTDITTVIQQSAVPHIPQNISCRKEKKGEKRSTEGMRIGKRRELILTSYGMLVSSQQFGFSYGYFQHKTKGAFDYYMVGQGFARAKWRFSSQLGS